MVLRSLCTRTRLPLCVSLYHLITECVCVSVMPWYMAALEVPLTPPQQAAEDCVARIRRQNAVDLEVFDASAAGASTRPLLNST